MKMNSIILNRALSAVFLLTLISACGPKNQDPLGLGTRSGDGSGDGGTSPNGQPLANCDVVFDTGRLASNGITLPAVIGDYIVVAPLTRKYCKSTRSVNGEAPVTVTAEGYSSVHVFKRPKALSQFKVDNTGGGTRLEIDVQTNSPGIGENEKLELAQALGADMGRYKSETSLEFYSALNGRLYGFVSSGAEYPLFFVEKTNSESEKFFIQLETNQVAQKLMSDLNRGTISLRIFSELWDSQTSARALGLEELSAQGGGFSVVQKLADGADLTISQWNAAAGNQDLRARVIGHIEYNLRMFPTSDDSKLKEIFAEADAAWNPIPSNVSRYDLNWMAATLRFLNSGKVAHPTAKIFQTFSHFSFDTNDELEAFNESLWLTQNTQLNDTQKNAYLEIYQKIKNLRLPITEVFTYARKIAGLTNYDSGAANDILSKLETAFDWLVSYSGPQLSKNISTLDRAEKYVFTNAISISQFGLLKDSFEWLVSYAGPQLSKNTSTLDRAENYIFIKKIDSTLFSKLKTVFEANLRNTSRMSALDAAEKQVLP